MELSLENNNIAGELHAHGEKYRAFLSIRLTNQYAKYNNCDIETWVNIEKAVGDVSLSDHQELAKYNKLILTSSSVAFYEYLANTFTFVTGKNPNGTVYSTNNTDKLVFVADDEAKLNGSKDLHNLIVNHFSTK